MTYTEIIVRELTRILGKLAKLELGQYVGHLANLDFWSVEVRHARDVLSGYDARLRRQRGAQVEAQTQLGKYVLQQYDSPSPYSGPPLKPALRDAERNILDRDLVEAFRQFLMRGIAGKLLEREQAMTLWKQVCGEHDLF